MIWDPAILDRGLSNNSFYINTIIIFSTFSRGVLSVLQCNHPNHSAGTMLASQSTPSLGLQMIHLKRKTVTITKLFLLRKITCFCHRSIGHSGSICFRICLHLLACQSKDISRLNLSFYFNNFKITFKSSVQYKWYKEAFKPPCSLTIWPSLATLSRPNAFRRPAISENRIYKTQNLVSSLTKDTIMFRT